MTWRIGGESFYEIKADKFNESDQFQIIYYCDEMQEARLRLVYGFLWNGKNIRFILVDLDGNAHISVEKDIDAECLKLAYLMCSRATNIPFVDVEGRKKLYSVSNTSVVLGLANRVVKLPTNGHVDLIENELQTSNHIGDKDKFTRVKRFYDDVVDENDPKRHCVEISPVMDEDLVAFLSNKDPKELLPLVDIIEETHTVHGRIHNDTRLENGLHTKGQFRLTDFAFAVPNDGKEREFNGGAPSLFVDERLGMSPKQDIGIFLKSTLYHVVGKEPEAFLKLHNEFYAYNGDIYDFARKWLQNEG